MSPCEVHSFMALVRIGTQRTKVIVKIISLCSNPEGIVYVSDF